MSIEEAAAQTQRFREALPELDGDTIKLLLSGNPAVVLAPPAEVRLKGMGWAMGIEGTWNRGGVQARVQGTFGPGAVRQPACSAFDHLTTRHGSSATAAAHGIQHDLQTQMHAQRGA